MADLDAALQLDAKDAAVYFNRGNLWKAKEEYAKAIEDYDEARDSIRSFRQPTTIAGSRLVR